MNTPSTKNPPSIRDQVFVDLSGLYRSVLFAAFLLSVPLIMPTPEVSVIPDTNATCGVALLLLFSIWAYANRLKATLKKALSSGALGDA